MTIRAYDAVDKVIVSGTMDGSAASDWIDLPIQPTIYAIHAVCTAGATWQIGNSDKTIVRTFNGPGSSHVGAPTTTRAGYIFYEAIPGGGASLRLLDTSGSSNVWTVWLKYYDH